MYHGIHKPKGSNGGLDLLTLDYCLLERGATWSEAVRLHLSTKIRWRHFRKNAKFHKYRNYFLCFDSPSGL